MFTEERDYFCLGRGGGHSRGGSFCGGVWGKVSWGRSHLRGLKGSVCGVRACGEEGMNIPEKRRPRVDTPLLVFEGQLCSPRYHQCRLSPCLLSSPTSFLNYPVPHSSLYHHILPLSSSFLRPTSKCCVWAPKPLFVSLQYHLGPISLLWLQSDFQNGLSLANCWSLSPWAIFLFSP